MCVNYSNANKSIHMSNSEIASTSRVSDLARSVYIDLIPYSCVCCRDAGVVLHRCRPLDPRPSPAKPYPGVPRPPLALRSLRRGRLCWMRQHWTDAMEGNSGRCVSEQCTRASAELTRAPDRYRRLPACGLEREVLEGGPGDIEYCWTVRDRADRCFPRPHQHVSDRPISGQLREC